MQTTGVHARQREHRRCGLVEAGDALLHVQQSLCAGAHPPVPRQAPAGKLRAATARTRPRTQVFEVHLVKGKETHGVQRRERERNTNMQQSERSSTLSVQEQVQSGVRGSRDATVTD